MSVYCSEGTVLFAQYDNIAKGYNQISKAPGCSSNSYDNGLMSTNFECDFVSNDIPIISFATALPMPPLPSLNREAIPVQFAIIYIMDKSNPNIIYFPDVADQVYGALLSSCITEYDDDGNIESYSSLEYTGTVTNTLLLDVV
jgi:hypothetical protein